MADISTWSPTDESNTAAPPAGWPENMQPSAVNNSARGMMGAIRRWYDTVTAQLASITTALGNYLPLSGGTLTGILSAPQYSINGIAFANRGLSGETLIYDGSASVALNLQPNDSFYDNNVHHFRNGAGTLTFSVDSAGNGGFTGNLVGGNVTAISTVTGGYIHSTGNVQADGALTGGSITVSGNMTTGNTITGGFIHSTGNIEANGTITADGAYINAAAYFLSGSVFANTGGIGERLIYDGGGGAALNLQANDSFYDNNTHHFRNSALGATFSLDSDGNGGFAGNISGANITATGSINAANIAATASIGSAGDIYSAGGYRMTDATGGNNFSIYSSSPYSYIQFIPGWFWRFDGTTLTWFSDSGDEFWVMRDSDHLCWNDRGPVGGWGGYVNLSDRRGKENITPSQRGLAEVVKLTPVEFNRISTIDTPREIGFTAQDVMGVLPEAVRVVGMTLPDGTGGLDDAEPTLGITDSTIVAALVNAVKELNARVVALEGEKG